MITYSGFHQCTFFVAGKKEIESCVHVGDQDIELVFDDCIVLMPQTIMHYLDPIEAISHIGWVKPWKPPAWFIHKVLSAKQILLQASRIDYSTKQVVKMGYLTHGSALKEFKKYKEIEIDLDVIIDTQGGDFNFNPENTLKAEFGDSPDTFLVRMATLIERANHAHRYLGALEEHKRDHVFQSQFQSDSLSEYEFPTIVEFTETATSVEPGCSFPLKPLMLKDRIYSSAEYHTAFLAFDAISTSNRDQLLKFATYLIMNALSWTAQDPNTYIACINFKDHCLFRTSKLQCISYIEISDSLCRLLREIGIISVFADNAELQSTGKVSLIINRCDALRLSAYRANIEISTRPDEEFFVKECAAQIDLYFPALKINANPFYCPPKYRARCREEEKYDYPALSMFSSGYQLIHINSTRCQQTTPSVSRKTDFFAPCTPNEHAELQIIMKPLDTLSEESHAAFCQKLDDLASNPGFEFTCVERRNGSKGLTSP